MEEKACISCKKKIVNDKGRVIFKCPKCENREIVRCSNCRSNAIQYSCPECGFKGPN
ncbi:MAG: zinc finger domain-containing protein [Nanoarchaeota archaeon]|nr:zinc finger domain-containing protein [Nanoarchaeota archaeon]